MSDYIPVHCRIYERYEIAILRGTQLRVAWRDASGGAHIETLRPRDLQTREHAEYLIADNGRGRLYRIRLDWIRDAEPVTAGPAVGPAAG